MHTESDKSVISYRELFFYLYFAIMFGMRMWGVYEGTRLYGPLLLVGLCFWGISVLMTEHTIFEYVIMAVLLAVAGAAYFNSGEKGLLLYFTLMLGMKGIEVKRLFKVGIAAGGAGMICLAFLAAFGITEDVIYIQTRPLLGNVFRHALGMPHPNTLCTSFIVISVMIMYLIGYSDRRRVITASLILCAISVYLYIYSGSRTGIVISLGYLVLNCLYSYRKKIGYFEKIGLFLLFPVIWGISILLPLLASDDLVNRLMEIDLTLMSRIAHAKNYLQYNPVTLFGTRLVNPESIYGIDFAQLYLLLNYGVLAFVIVTSLNIFLLVYEVRQNRIQELVITVLFLLMGLTDPFLYNISYKNVCFVFIGVMLFKYSEAVALRLPSLMQHKIRIIKPGDRGFELRAPGFVSDIINGSAKLPGGRKAFVLIGAAALAAVTAIAVYVSAPTPEYAMIDRNSREHFAIKGLEGRTYTEQEIDDIKSEGNIVLNYTDENELMYVYYSDENHPFEGSFYAPNAAIMEKVRKSVSIFFWGTALLTVISAAVVSKQYSNGNKNEQGQV